jgi:RND family efflux transporter MFP subunit
VKTLKYALIVSCGIIASIIVLIGIVRGVHAGISGPAPAPPRAAVAVVQRGSVANTYSIAGEFLPYQEVELHAKVAGYLSKIFVDIGDRVRAGDVLALLEVPELNAQVLEAVASVRRDREEIGRMRNEVSRAEADYSALHAGAQRLQEVAQVRPGLVAQQELDDASAKDHAAAARVDAAKSQLAVAQEELTVAKATRLQVSAMQNYARIIAPFDGVVTWRYADTGALIQAGTANSQSMPVVKLAQVDVLRLRIPVPESLVPKVSEGTVADIRVQATGERFSGKVVRYTDSLDRSTRSMQVEVDVPNPKFKLSPGMFADVSIQVESRSSALTVPVQSVDQNGDKATVLAVDGQDRVHIRQILVGIQDANRVEILAGLHEGDKVIIGDSASYQEGQRVVPVPSNMTGAALDGKGSD